MLFDQTYTYSPTDTCATGAVCPTFTVTCYPPYTWSPYQFTFDIINSASPSTYNGPTVIDCLGRYLTIYSPQTMYLPSGNSQVDANGDALYFAYVASQATDQFTISLKSTSLNYLGSRSFRLMASLGQQFTVPIYLQVLITQPDSNLPRLPSAVNNNPGCSYDKIYPFLFGHAGLDVVLINSNMD